MRATYFTRAPSIEAPRRHTISRPRSRGHRQRTRRLSRRDQRQLGALLLLVTPLCLWWGLQHVPAWLPALPHHLAVWIHTPAAWLDLGAIVLATGGLFALLAWCIHRRRQHGQARTLRLAEIAAVEPLAFEVLVGQRFAREGFEVTVTKGSRDNGIDLWLRRPGQPAIPVQCKRYRAGKVGSPALQAFSGALRFAGASEGIFVTAACYTPAAVTWAKQEHIGLIDGPALAEWQHRLDHRSTVSERRAGRPIQQD